MARQRFVPKRGVRGTAGYAYYELSMAQGPSAIGVTGQNRLIDLIGSQWLLLVDLDSNLHLFKQSATVGDWDEVTASLPPVFDAPLPEGARRVSFCFDQSARVVIAYEKDETVYLTRWDATLGAYVQNVTMPGVDPVVAFDATWSYDVTDSDVLLFYLSTDRAALRYRVQRQLYATENTLHTYGQPVVLDRVQRLPLRYQVLASDAAGEPLVADGERVALVSDVYPIPASDGFALGGAFSDLAQVADTYFEDDDDTLTLGAHVADVVAVGNVGTVDAPDEQPFIIGAVFGDAVIAVGSVAVRAPDPDDLGVAAAFGDTAKAVVDRLVVTPDPEEAFEVGATIGGSIRAQTV